MTSHFSTLQACRTFKMTNKRCVTEKVKMCICTICFCMCVVYFVFWYVKHRLLKNPTYLPYFFFYVTPIKHFFRPKSKKCLQTMNAHIYMNFLNILIQTSMEDLFFFSQTLSSKRTRKPLCMLVWIDMIHNMCQWHSDSGGGLFLKNVFQGGCPLYIQQLRNFLMFGSGPNLKGI